MFEGDKEVRSFILFSLVLDELIEEMKRLVNKDFINLLYR